MWWIAILGTAELESIIHDNKLPAVIEETGKTLRQLLHDEGALHPQASMAVDRAEALIRPRLSVSPVGNASRHHGLTVTPCQKAR